MHVRLMDGPARGQELTIPKDLWDYGILRVMVDSPEPFEPLEDMSPYAPKPAVHIYRRTLMAYRPTDDTPPRYWHEWRYDRPNRMRTP